MQALLCNPGGGTRRLPGLVEAALGVLLLGLLLRAGRRRREREGGEASPEPPTEVEQQPQA